MSPPRAIALATCAHHPGFIADDDGPVQAALASRGIDAPLVRWDDPEADWAAFDAVVIRTTWDYTERPHEFLDWCDATSRATRLINGPDLVRWNLDKRYLRDLEGAGLPIVPTRWLEPGAGPGGTSLEAVARDTGWDELVCKPAIGAGASGLVRTRAADAAQAQAHADGLLTAGPVLVQPWVGSILDRGELSVVVIGGEVSHAVRKTPADGEFRVQIEFGGRYEPEAPGERARSIARAAWAAGAARDGPGQGGGGAAYARVDLVELGDGSEAIIELEMVEPELFFAIVPGAADRFVEAVVGRLSGG